ncbi:hypothetical protein EYR41_004100 [Orbilia oligospora]|uniref:Uncharacterized protein n=1 Tax=Orbilia oligospora TaxID=2813651 RepID=A0A7C8PF21_ORBOL|nr:hypothetical protein TWF751_009225 [Orbilia oligospora]TGJ72190.1 hypothetical protein EYR41_004100 [Orbilia oligospora]
MDLDCTLVNADETAPTSSGRQKEVDFRSILLVAGGTTRIPSGTLVSSSDTLNTSTCVETISISLPTDVNLNSSSTSAPNNINISSPNTIHPDPKVTKPSNEIPTKTTPSPPEDHEPNVEPDQNNPDPAKRTDRISSSMFYESAPFIRCASKLFVMSLRPHNNALQSLGIHAYEFPQNYWRSERMRNRRPQILRRIQSRQWQCKSCRCDDNGMIIGRTGFYPRDDLTTRNCPTQRFADECGVFYACHCQVVLNEDPPGPKRTDVTIDDYQDALDRIPNLYKIGKIYRFDVGRFYGGDSHYLSWEGAERYRTLAPDTKEPYWLEGPDEFQEELSNKWLGLEYNSSSGGFKFGSSMVKREEGADDLRGVEKEAF